MKQQKSIFKVFEFVIDSMFSIKIYDQRWLSHNIIEIDCNLSFSRYFKYLLWPIDLGDFWMSIIIVNPYYPVRLSKFEQVMWQLNNWLLMMFNDKIHITIKFIIIEIIKLNTLSKLLLEQSHYNQKKLLWYELITMVMLMVMPKCYWILWSVLCHQLILNGTNRLM